MASENSKFSAWRRVICARSFSVVVPEDLADTLDDFDALDALEGALDDFDALDALEDALDDFDAVEDAADAFEEDDEDDDDEEDDDEERLRLGWGGRCFMSSSASWGGDEGCAWAAFFGLARLVCSLRVASWVHTPLMPVGMPNCFWTQTIAEAKTFLFIGSRDEWTSQSWTSSTVGRGAWT